MAGDDAVELGERFHLVDDHPAHLRRALGGLLRQLEHAAAQFLARVVELALHVGRHLLHRLHDLGEAVGGLLQQLLRLDRVLLEQALAVVRHLLVKFVQGFARALVLRLGGGADRRMLLGDRARAFRGRFGDQPRDIAGTLLRGAQQFIEQAREPLQPLVEVLGAAVHAR